MHAIRIVYRVRIVGGELRDETDGSTDTCRWLHGRSVAAPPRRLARNRPSLRARLGTLTRQRSDAQRDRDRHRRPRRLVFALAQDVERWATCSPTTPGRGPSNGAPTARSSSTSSRAGRSSACSGWACRWPGGRAPGTSRRRDACASSTSPARPGGWTSPGGSTTVPARRLPRHDRARLRAAPAVLRRLRRPLLHPADRRSDARHLQGDRRGVARA